jgi:hypothetical protein
VGISSLFISKKDIFKMLGGYSPAFFFQRNTFLKCLVGIHQPFLIPTLDIFKMLGGYPPAFVFQRKIFLKC